MTKSQKETILNKNFLGYDKGKNGKPVINEKEAEIVRLIYRLFIQGKTASGICKHLDGLGIPTGNHRPFGVRYGASRNCKTTKARSFLQRCIYFFKQGNMR